jgi:hypothetical protein
MLNMLFPLTSKRSLSLCCVVLSGAVSLFGSSAAHATTITYNASGSGTDGALGASAVFTTSAGMLTVTLSDTLAASVIRSAGQAVSDLSFTLSNSAGTLTNATASGQLGNVSSTGVVTYTTGSPTRFLGAGGQGNFSVSGSTVTLEAIGGGKPTEMITPTVANGGTLSNVNNGFQQFNPYTIGPATFMLSLSGVTANTTINAATFSFGTGPDTFLTGTPSGPSPSPVPEPSSLLLLGTGIVGAGGALRRSLKRA